MNNYEEDEFIRRISVQDAVKFGHPNPSPFLCEKLIRFNNVMKFSRYQNIWLTEEIVIKRYIDKAVAMQKRLLDTWENVDEWFIISRNGGKSLEEGPWDDNFRYKMKDVHTRLLSIGFVSSDFHPGNFVIDSKEICRVIDYESIIERN